ncbi:MAG: DUF4175 family protein [Terriglobia bacterium]
MDHSPIVHSGKPLPFSIQVPELTAIQKKIHSVRRKLLWSRLTRGLSLICAVFFVVWIVAIFTANHWNYTPLILLLTRSFSLLALFGLLAQFLVRPLFGSYEDARIARYIEERFPELEDRLASVVEFKNAESAHSSSNLFFTMLLRDTWARLRAIDLSPLFRRRPLWISAGLVAAFTLTTLVLLVKGPSFFRFATFKLYAPWWLHDSSSLYKIAVRPGSLQLAKGSELLVTAELVGFDNPQAILFSRSPNAADWERRKMEPERNSRGFRFLFLDVNEHFRYFVRSGTIQSQEFSITVIEKPYVKQIEVKYLYPSYTGLSPRIEEDSPDLTAIAGTLAVLKIESTADVSAGRIRLQDGSTLPLIPKGPRLFQGSIPILKDTSYHIQWLDPSQNVSDASHEYSIKALTDQPPVVAFTRPGRDHKATSLEEVLTEVKAEDDFSIRNVDLHFSINGRPEEIVSLFGNKGQAPPSPLSPSIPGRSNPPPASQSRSLTPLRTVIATHTFFLESYSLEPGDVISYFATASDAKGATSSDMYFLEIRPFGKQYTQRQVSSGPEQSASASDLVLSNRQKEILAATWKLIRDRKTFGPEEYLSNVQLVSSQQLKLQQQTQSLSNRMERRALTSRDPTIQKLSEDLLQANEAMGSARELLESRKVPDAIRPEQVSLQFLLRAEAQFKQIQVAYGNGPGPQANGFEGQELENLFELELDKLKNQYETQSQRDSSSSRKELDEAYERLKALAERQQQSLERRRRAVGTQSATQGNFGDPSFQADGQEAERLARQLERLSREMQDPDLERASRQMRQAVRELSPSTRAGDSSSAENQGLRALSRMNEAKQLLGRKALQGVAQQIDQLNRTVQSLKEREEQVLRTMSQNRQSSLRAEKSGPATAEGKKRGGKESSEQQALLEQKTQLARLARGVELDLKDLAQKSSAESNSLSKKLEDSAKYLRDRQWQEGLRQSSLLVSLNQWEQAESREKKNLQILEGLQERLQSARQSMGPSPETSRANRLSEALNRANELATSLESLSHRIQEWQKSSNSSGSTAPSSPPNVTQHSAPGNSPRQESTASQSGNEKTSARSIPLAPQASSSSGKKSSLPVPGMNSDQSVTTDTAHAGPVSPESSHASIQVAPAGNAAVNFGDTSLPPTGNDRNETQRQLARELALRIGETRELSRHLSGEQELTRQLRNMIEQMEALGFPALSFQPQPLEKLQSEVIEGFHQLERQLSESLGKIIFKENLQLPKPDEVPSSYRTAVSDYFKSLSQK